MTSSEKSTIQVPDISLLQKGPLDRKWPDKSSFHRKSHGSIEGELLRAPRSVKEVLKTTKRIAMFWQSWNILGTYVSCIR